VVGFRHGTAGDGDDRQGNGACRGNMAALFCYIPCGISLSWAALGGIIAMIGAIVNVAEIERIVVVWIRS